jgi:hypothetical protein
LDDHRGLERMAKVRRAVNSGFLRRGIQITGE